MLGGFRVSRPYRRLHSLVQTGDDRARHGVLYGNNRTRETRRQRMHGGRCGTGSDSSRFPAGRVGSSWPRIIFCLRRTWCIGRFARRAGIAEWLSGSEIKLQAKQNRLIHAEYLRAPEGIVCAGGRRCGLLQQNLAL